MTKFDIFLTIIIVVLIVMVGLLEIWLWATRNKCRICGDSLEDNHFHIDNFHG